MWSFRLLRLLDQLTIVVGSHIERKNPPTIGPLQIPFPGEKTENLAEQRQVRSSYKHEAQTSESLTSNTLAGASCLYLQAFQGTWRCPVRCT